MKIPAKPIDYDAQAFGMADYEDAVELWHSVDGVTLNESDSYAAIESFLQRNPGYGLIVRNQDKECVATVLCGHNGRAGHLYHLVVKSEHQEQGLATWLTQQCLAQLKYDKIPRCNVFVYSDNAAGNQFWLNTDWNDPTHWKVLQKMTGE